VKAARVSLRYATSLALLLLAWQGAVMALAIPPYLLPEPVSVAVTLGTEWFSFLAAAGTTFGNMLIGALLGISSGFLLGMLTAFSRRIRWVVEPYLTIFQSFPREAFFPLLVVWLGFGSAPKVVNAALLSFFPMAVITLNSLLNTRTDYVQLIRSWRASRLQEFLFCRLPAAVPELLSALRICFPLALIGAVLGEFLGGSSGLGYIIVSSGSNFRIDRVFAAIAVLAMGGLAVVAALDALRMTILRRYHSL
jgi:ABC-type nitrate/sulfonate/bicarbonate transport system permease component